MRTLYYIITKAKLFAIYVKCFDINVCFKFLTFISNTNIVSINFRASLDAQNAGKSGQDIFRLQISKNFPLSMHINFGHGYPPVIYYFTERSFFKKILLLAATRNILKSASHVRQQSA